VLLKQAQAAAREQDVCVTGGTNIAQQYIAAGLLEEISVHLVPVSFGSGTRLFEHLGDEHLRLEPVATVETAPAVHLRFRVLR
jgi:dihydrofolate reductase